MSVLHLDFETYCELDLRKVGVENYVQHPSFTVTVLAWAFDDEPVQAQTWPNNGLPQEVRVHIKRGGEVRAHNAAFEAAVLSVFYGLPVAYSQMNCTMQRALSYGLPGGLLKAGKALGLSIIKDETKRLLMLQMSKPRKGNDPWHKSDPARLNDLAEYCKDDVEAERELDGAIPHLHPLERDLSLLDAKINAKGVMLDRAAIKALRAAALRALTEINGECTKLTRGEVTSPGTQTLKLLTWVNDKGLQLPDVTKETIEATLTRTGLPALLRRVLELRQQAAKASVAKLDRMLDVMSSKDDRARNLLQFAGAGRTLRWAGRLVQPQNLPRSDKAVSAEQVIGAAKQDPTGLGLLWGSAMDAISKSLRSCFIAKPGYVLVSIDLSQIEARVLAWMAGQHDIVEAFRKGEDIYVIDATKVGSTNRQLGKVLRLACGFGMGWQKFQETAAAAPYRITLSDADAKTHLYNWRNANPAIVDLWGAVENKVRVSLYRGAGQIWDLPHGMKVRTAMQNYRLVTQIRKPNGVKLTYHNMRLCKGDLIFDGVNSTTKNWGVEKAYGGRLVENLVQSIARDVMAEAMARSGLVPVMSVHDEIVWEVPEDERYVKGAALKALVNMAPAWAPDLPIASEMSIGRRYAK